MSKPKLIKMIPGDRSEWPIVTGHREVTKEEQIEALKLLLKIGVITKEVYEKDVEEIEKTGMLTLKDGR
jgi:hypothetical protein